MEIPPCTEGKHSTTDLPPQIEKNTPQQQQPGDPGLFERLEVRAPTPSRTPVPAAPRSRGPTPPPESEDDDPDLEIADGRMCRRKGCGAVYRAGQSRDGERCVH